MIREFSYPQTFKWGVTFVIIVLLIFSGVGVLLLFVFFQHIPDLIRHFLLAAALLPLLLLRYLYNVQVRLKEKILVDDNAIVYRKANGDTTTLPWGQIGRISEYPFQQRLTVHDYSETITIPIEYQLEGFDQLRDRILSQARHLHNMAQEQTMFHPHRLKVQGSFLAALLFLGSLYYHLRGFPITSESVSFSLFWGGIILMLINNPWSVRVESDHVVIRYPLYRRTVFFRDIRSIHMINEIKNYNARSVVEVILQNNKKIRLAYLKEGSIALYRSLHGVWKDYERKAGE
jgi:hypothetical protein